MRSCVIFVSIFGPRLAARPHMVPGRMLSTAARRKVGPSQVRLSSINLNIYYYLQLLHPAFPPTQIY